MDTGNLGARIAQLIYRLENVYFAPRTDEGERLEYLLKKARVMQKVILYDTSKVDYPTKVKTSLAIKVWNLETEYAQVSAELYLHTASTQRMTHESTNI